MPDTNTLSIPVIQSAMLIIQTCCGIIILFFVDLWLRLRTVNDWSLTWLYLSLLSWLIRGYMELTNPLWIQYLTHGNTDEIKYLFSPISSILFTITALNLLRVRDWLKRERLDSLRPLIICIVIILSLVALALLICNYPKPAKIIDIFASILSLLTLLLALGYSFTSYDSPFLAFVAVCTILLMIIRQFWNAYPNPTDINNMYFNISTTALLTMLFVAIALAWALSDISRLKPVSASVNVNIVALFFDLRGSTQWAHEVAEKDFNYVRIFLNDLREWSLNQAEASSLGQPQIIKFLGDGYMFVWEAPNNVAQSAKLSVALAYSLFTGYPEMLKKAGKKWALGVPDAIGVGVDFGRAIRFKFENGSDDYLGSTVNTAAKLQNFARPRGGVVIQTLTWNLLDDLRDQFPKEGKIKFGDRDISLRMTENIEPPNNDAI